MKELLITLITLAGLFIGVYYHDSLAVSYTHLTLPTT